MMSRDRCEKRCTVNDAASWWPMS